VLALLLLEARAEEAVSEERFAAESLRYRTALHYDPLLEAPLESLVKLYIGGSRAEELVGLYRTHVEQYPDDAGAKTVLIRVLRRLNHEAADEAVNSIVPQHPEFAPLQFVFFRYLEERGDARAPEALSRAIDLETNPTRRNEWLDLLLRLSEGELARGLVNAHFQKLLARDDLSLEEWLSLARLMQRYQFWLPSLNALNRARAGNPTPETGIEIDLLLALALNHEGEKAKASGLLDGLLAKLASDHWRRREILSLRLEGFSSPEDREAFVASLESVVRSNPESEAAVLDYAEALVAVERRSEAVDALTSALARLPSSRLIETRAIEWLETEEDLETFARFLTDRLETDPARLDLRFRLVKVEYALGRDADAEQDFEAVVAGLDPAEASARILELQRFLRGIERLDAAASYLERYVRNHPTRLDVARELAEVRIAAGQSNSLGELMSWLQPDEAETENVLDFAGFLLEGGFVIAARSLVEAKLAREPRQFDLGLQLIEILGRAGDANATGANIAAFRDLADSGPRYAQWLGASIAAHRALETLPAFFDAELNRYAFDEGPWTAERVGRFLILCESGKAQFLAARVAEGLRRQLAQKDLDPALRLQLRKVLVTVLESDPTAAPEAEEQLGLLTDEDPASRAEYDLRRVLVYHRSQRVDLAQALAVTVDFAAIENPVLLREATDLLIEYGFLSEAESALSVVNRLEPKDLLSWERRLSVLVTLGNESTLRALLRALRTGEAGVTFRALSNQSLDEHLDASYWRSIAGLLREDPVRYGEILPLLASAEREVITSTSGLWSEWTRAHLLSRLGQVEESAEAIGRFRVKAAERALERVRFPDGLELTVDAAGLALGANLPVLPVDDDRSADFLLARPLMQWAFELPEGSSVVRFERSEDRLLVLDDLDRLHVLDVTTGKLLWSRAYPEPGERPRRPAPFAFREVGAPSPLLRKPGKAKPKPGLPRDFGVMGDRFFLLCGDELTAHAIHDGTILWIARMALPKGKGSSRSRIRFAVSEDLVVAFSIDTNEVQAFETETGKLVWALSLGGEASSEADLPSPYAALNAGLSLHGGRVFLYGRGSAIVDLASGQRVWTLGEAPPSSFPLVLRPDREEEAAVGSGAAKSAVPPEPIVMSGRPTKLFDFQANEGVGKLEPQSFLEGGSALLSPAQFWVQSRHLSDGPALGRLSPGALWLMQGGKIRRISSDLPVASLELAASGTWIGRAGKHVWFLDGNTLHHADFGRDRVSRLSVDDLGDPAILRATVVGNQVIVRGASAVRVINALSGEVLGQSAFPTTLVDYLQGFGFAGERPRDREESQSSEFAWQGRLLREDPVTAGLSVPVTDLLSGSQYHTVFGDRLVVSLGAGGDETVLPPPAPDAPDAPVSSPVGAPISR